MKESKLAKDTHQLERVKIKTGKSIERKQAKKGNSRTREGRDWSVHENKAMQLGMLTR